MGKELPMTSGLIAGLAFLVNGAISAGIGLIPLVGAYATAIVGLVFALLGIKYASGAVDELTSGSLEGLGAGLLVLGLLVGGVTLFAGQFGMAIPFLPSWFGVGAVALGVVLKAKPLYA